MHHIDKDASKKAWNCVNFSEMLVLQQLSRLWYQINALFPGIALWCLMMFKGCVQIFDLGGLFLFFLFSLHHEHEKLWGVIHIELNHYLLMFLFIFTLTFIFYNLSLWLLRRNEKCETSISKLNFQHAKDLVTRI